MDITTIFADELQLYWDHSPTNQCASINTWGSAEAKEDQVRNIASVVSSWPRFGFQSREIPASPGL